MTKLLVVGKTGQLASALNQLSPDFSLACHTIGRPEVDLFDEQGVFDAILAEKPSVLVNAAAYTQVDTAETDQKKAYAVNQHAVRQMAEAAKVLDIPFIHVSTDYVYDGQKQGSYLESDPTNPQGIYGHSKLAGEQDALATHDKVIILRTAWVYSAIGKNFVKTMLNLAEIKDSLGIVADQKGNPTSALDIAQAIFKIIIQITDNGWQSSYSGLYHLAGTGDTTWFGLACKTFALYSQKTSNKIPEVSAITTADYPTPAKRPENSCLNCQKLEDTFGIRLPNWEQSLEKCIHQLVES
ncbi:dTDP-4-dehydrorhamnose reductase [Temperatibacter marinus]|uniref:dTDP-4-dehydrorhamnose reductase n=1 Tax=Temperatibacter marinus TaxID=1456591 RepID=A0AA52EED8_9PROT|nr:dTDP-4-dehydrorhamnose reductase [Temperatibacter marinus]WND03180.1 dTDP-4-dehydrorhamnose reductase [Temperatibacter marinus]